MRDRVKKVGILVFWLVFWQVLAVVVNKPLVLVGPIETAEAFLAQIGEVSFWKTIGWSTGRIACGFLLAFVAGFLAGGLSSRFSWFRELLEPIVTLMRAVPVASFVILVLIWVGVKGLTLAISFLVVFPIIYQSTLLGFAAADRELLEMGHVFSLSAWKRFLYIYRPALMPALMGGCKTALGMSWKSGVAAEVIGTPDFSIGAELYMAKIYFDTAELFAWTAVIILLSVCFERGFLWIMGRLAQPFGGLLLRGVGVRVQAARPTKICLEGVSKSFGSQNVLADLHLVLEPGGIYGLTAPSGAGKTTLLRILMGLERADAGIVSGLEGQKISVAFQEQRLCPDLAALENACMAGGEPALAEILPEESLAKEASALSGGMKRRVAVARAMAAVSDLVLLDEPFSGLDPETKERVIRYILAKQNGRTLVFTTHVKEDLNLMQAVHVELPALTETPHPAR